MLKSYLLFAQAADPMDLARLQPPTSRVFGLAMRDFLLLMAVLGALALVLFVFVWFVRRNRHRPPVAGARVIYHSVKREEGKFRNRRKRTRHPENLPRNPTLAEAGGLPPIRDDRAKPAC